ncbi:MAG: cyclic nucleotide-binding domain-containing protein [Alphaproteobacteria bacterium]|nr:cyclic nucleotide-binding domain-containing protein [Alphaproteobacteria bacterium]
MILHSADGTAEIPRPLIDGPMFSGVVRRERRDFLSRLPAERVGPSVTLFEQGDPGDSVRIMLKGSVTLRRRTEGGELIELGRCRALDLFGELSVVSPGPRFTTATSLEPCVMLILDRKVFKDLLNDRHPAAESLMRYITFRVCRRLRQTDARIALVHDALRGANVEELRRRVAELNDLSHYA